MFNNYPTRGDYNTEALIFKMAVARFLDVSEEETKKMKEYAVKNDVIALVFYL